MKQYISIHRYPIFLGLGIFLLVYIFFSAVHPVYPYDLDDWKIMLRVRELYPSIYEWNPTRILPEFLMPRCGELAMTVVYPIVGDITISICIVTASLLALLITLYMLFFYRYLRRTALLSGAISTLLTLLFFTFHFLIFRILERDNQHLFYSYDLTDHYFYTVPNVLGSLLVLAFMTDRCEHFNLKTSVVKKGVFLLAIYLLVFSNLFDSIILSAYLGSLLLFRITHAIINKVKWGELIKQYKLQIAVIVLWLAAIGFEPFGGNAQEINAQTQSFSEALVTSAKNMRQVIFFQTNTFATILIGLSILLFLVKSFWKKEEYKEREPLYILLFAAMVSAVFLVLLGAVSFPYYLLRVMSIYAVPFFLILSGFFCVSKLLKEFPKSSVLLPFLLLIVFCKTEERGKTFQDVQTFLIPNDQQYCYQIPPKEILAQNRRNIDAIISANNNGQETLTLFVPKFEQDGNWPISWSHGRALYRFLLHYHLISNKMEVSIDRDSQMKDFSK